VKRASHFAGGIGKQRNFDLADLSELRKHFLRFAGNTGDAQALLGEFFLGMTQLDQPSLTAGSPLGGFVEEENQPFGSSEIFEVAKLAVLIGNRERGNASPHRKGNRLDWLLIGLDRSNTERRDSKKGSD
jgi:hypothetical protein